jgi:hypothetical protein
MKYVNMSHRSSYLIKLLMSKVFMYDTSPFFSISTFSFMLEGMTNWFADFDTYNINLK